MKPGIVTAITFLLSFILIMAGTYLIIDDFIKPNGLLFEGILSAIMGIVLFLLGNLLIAFEKTIEVFGQIYMQQSEMNELMIKSMSNQGPSKGLADILPGIGNMTITDLDTGETKSAPLSGEDAIKQINDMISGAMKKSLDKKNGLKNKNLDDMNLKELEKELSKAIQNDNFEKASKIKELIAAKNSSSDSDSEDSTEK